MEYLTCQISVTSARSVGEPGRIRQALEIYKPEEVLRRALWRAAHRHVLENMLFDLIEKLGKRSFQIVARNPFFQKRSEQPRGTMQCQRQAGKSVALFPGRGGRQQDRIDQILCSAHRAIVPHVVLGQSVEISGHGVALSARKIRMLIVPPAQPLANNNE